MARSAVRAAAVGRTPGGPSTEAKLALVELLVGVEDPAECIQRALDWLGEHVGLAQAVIAEIDETGSRLVASGGYGLPAGRIEQFSLDLEEREHPLVAALAPIRTVVLEAEAAAPVLRVLPFRGPIAVSPFEGLRGGERVLGGVLMGSPGSPSIAGDLHWLAEILGNRVIRTRWLRRVARERSLLYSILNAVPDPVMLTDSEGRLLIANTRAEALFASRPEQSEGRRRAVALNNMLFSAALGESSIKDAAPDRRELLLVDSVEGSDLLFELLSTVAGDSREGMGVVSVLRNVTDLRRATEEIEANYGRLRVAESEVRAERDRLDLILESVADPVVVSDPSGNIIRMNDAADRFFTEVPSASPEEIQRVRANDANFTSFVSNVFFGETDPTYRGGVNMVDIKTGVPVPVEARSGKIISDQHGELTAVVTILRDQTEALELERLYGELKLASSELERKVREATAELVRQNELLRRQAMELEQASSLKSQFLANMSHEFRTPLNAILGYTSMLLKGVLGPLTPEHTEGLTRVDSNSRHLLGIINDILDISRIEAGRMPLRITRFRLATLVAEVLAELEPIIVQSDLAIATALDPRLPPVRTDRQKLKQIILNLLTNAVKFTPHGAVTVSAMPSEDPPGIAISVADTGVGIAAADQARIFEDFQQADNSPTRTYGGAGLGLSICNRLVIMLGGHINVESKLDEGSTFTVVLPSRRRRR